MTDVDAPEAAPAFPPFRPPVVPREWGFMAARAAAVLGLSVAIVAATVALAAPAPVRWQVRTSGTASAASLTTAHYLCTTVAASRTLAQEQYVLGAAVPSTAAAARAWASGTTAPTTGPASPAVVCVFRTTVGDYGPNKLVPDIVTVIAGARAIQTYYLSSIPTAALRENTIGAADRWFVG